MAITWICRRCKEPLVTKKILFEYLDNEISHEVPCCPKCGEVYISPELARGKMAEVEMLFEEK